MPENEEQKFQHLPDLKKKKNCMSCESPFATAWSTSDGTAWLCRECANLHGLGCP